MKLLPTKSFILAGAILAATASAGSANAMAAGTAFDAAAWQRYTKNGAECFKNAEYGQAERDFVAALNEARKLPPRDVRLATSLTNLGVVYNSRGRDEKALPLFEQAVQIQLAALGPEHPDSLAGQTKLCQFYMSHGSFEKAVPYEKRILNNSIKKLKELSEVTQSFDKLSRFYQAHQPLQLEDAEIMMAKAKQDTQHAMADEYLELAVLLDKLGSSANVPGHYDEAEQFYSKALALREKVLASNHIALAASYENLGTLLLTQNKPIEAESPLKKSYDISRRTLGETKPETYNRLTILARCLASASKSNEAEELYKRALESFAKDYGAGSKYVADLDLALGTLYAHEGRYQQAAPLMDKALKTTEQLNGPSHASVSSILDTYAEVLDKINRKNEASKLRARAKGIRG